MLIALLLVSVSACKVREQKKVVATVDGAEITEKVIKWKMNERLKEHNLQGAKVDTGNMRAAVIDQAIAEKLLSMGAKEKGITMTDADVKAHVDASKQAMGPDVFNKALAEAGISEKDYADITREKLLSGMFTKSLAEGVTITDDVLKEVYKNSSTPILMPDTVTMRFMQFSAQAEADRAVQDISAAGGNFDKVADAYAKDKKGTVSGYGEVSPAMFDPAMAKVLKTMAAGSHEGPIKTKGGWYLVRLKQHNPARPKTFEEAKGEIRQMMLQGQQNSAIVEWLTNRKATAKIVVNN